MRLDGSSQLVIFFGNPRINLNQRPEIFRRLITFIGPVHTYAFPIWTKSFEISACFSSTLSTLSLFTLDFLKLKSVFVAVQS